MQRAGGKRFIRGVLWALLALLSTGGAPAQSLDLLLIKSGEGSFYDQASKGLLETLEKHGYSVRVQTVVLKRVPDDKPTIRSALQRRPQGVVALGTDALLLVKEVQEQFDPSQRVPVVFSLVIDPVSLGVVESEERSGTRFTGVVLTVPPQRQIRALLDVAPHAKRIGVLYNPNDDTSNRLISTAQESASKLGVELVLAHATNKEQIPTALQNLKGKVDALWLIPDPVCASPEPFGLILAFANEQKLPLLSFSDGFVRRGALVGVGVDFTEQGVLAGEQLIQVLQGTPPEEMPLLTPRRLLTTYNLAQARRLGIRIPDALLNLADKVYEQ